MELWMNRGYLGERRVNTIGQNISPIRGVYYARYIVKGFGNYLYKSNCYTRRMRITYLRLKMEPVNSNLEQHARQDQKARVARVTVADDGRLTSNNANQ